MTEPKFQTERLFCPRCRSIGTAVWAAARARHQRDLESLSAGFKSVEVSETSPPALFCSACDIAVAGPRSTFALTEARIGVAPAIISLTLLPKLSARAVARYYLTGETFDAGRAAEIGLITEAAEDVDAAVDKLVSDIGRGSPQGLAASKALTTAAVLEGFDRDAERLAEESARLFVSDEAREGMLAFLEKRSPNWMS